MWWNVGLLSAILMEIKIVKELILRGEELVIKIEINLSGSMIYTFWRGFG